LGGDHEQVAEIVRAASPDRYVSALYAPAQQRRNLFALYAFDAEIARIRDRVSEPLPGEIRMQWWRDIVNGERTAEASGHPVASSLCAAISECDLPRQAFDNLISARIFDLYDDPMPSRNDLEGYCGETVSAVFQLAALILHPVPSNDLAECAGHGGIAYGVAAIVESIPRHRARRQCYVPGDILEAAGTDCTAFLHGDDADAGRRAATMMVALASDHLKHFEASAGKLPREQIPAFLPLAAMRSQLNRLERYPAGGEGGGLTAMRQLQMLWRATRGWAR
jgi:phytoene synthase